MKPPQHSIPAAFMGGWLLVLGVVSGVTASSSLVVASAANGSFDSLAAEAAKARESGRLDEAADLYSQALALRDDWLEGRWDLATVQFQRGAYPEARDQATRLVTAQPNNGAALALRGICEARLKNESQALTDLLNARQLGVEAPGLASVATLHTALLLNRSENPDAALQVLRRFTNQGNDSPAVITAFGLSLLRLKYLPEEIPEDKREMIVLAGRGGYEMARSRRTETGRMALEELVARYPNEPNVHFALGRYLAVEDPAAAIVEFRRELGVSPDNYAAMVHIVFAELQAGRAAQVLPLAQKAASLAPQAPVTRAALARTLLAVGEVDQAIRELESAIALVPENPRLHYILAQAYRDAGRTEDMERERQEFLRLKQSAAPDPDDGDADTDTDGNARTSTEAP
jgi:predicted Zn-dependent protease